MSARSVLPLVLALLAAGCAGSPAAPTPATGDPPAATGTPSSSPAPPTAPPAADCGEMTLTAEPARIRPGEEVVFRGVFRNCGDAPLRYNHTCLRPPWHPRVETGGATYHAWTNGSAVKELVCPAILVMASLGPGERLEEAWRWNGTFAECHDCATFDPAPGTYRFTSVLTKEAVLVPEGGRAWNASVEVEVLPRG